MSTKYVQSNTLFLAGSGTIIGATTIVLTTLTDIYGNVLTMTDFGAKGYVTLEPDTNNEEAATFTGITANANGTYTLTGVSSGLAKSPYTETSGLARQHAGGSKIVITDNVEFWNTFANKTNDEIITGTWTFNNFPITPGNPVASDTVLGITKLSVAASNPLSPVAVGTNDSRIPIAYAIDSVGTDAYAITPSPAITAYTAGQQFTFKAGTANTGAATLNVNALGAKTIKKDATLDLSTGDILSGQIVIVVYDGTNMQMESRTPSPSTNVQVFTSNGTWTKPVGAKSVTIIAIGAGGGGQGGATGSVVGNMSGGGGGAATVQTYDASVLNATETIVVGTGGTGGTAGSGGGSGGGGGGGGGGGDSKFGTIVRVIAHGGFPGNSSGTGGDGGSVGPFTAASGSQVGGIGSTNSNAEWGGGGANGATTLGGSSIYACGAGGRSQANSAAAGGDGGTVGTYTAGGGGVGGASGMPGVAGASNLVIGIGYGGAGGGGGGTLVGTTNPNSPGGAGGFPGGGGGAGGGTSLTGAASIGGAGANGQVTVITYL